MLGMSLACLLVGGCGDNGPSIEPDPLALAVRAEIDSAAFRAGGDFALDLVPADRSGHTFLTDPWEVSTTLSAPAILTLQTTSLGVQPPDSQPVASAILIDDSGSMRFSDPDRARATAAQLFWSDILPARAGNMVALLDFGRGDAVPTPGFERTVLLAPFTTDGSALESALAQIQAVPGAATPLYASVLEVIAWMDTSTPSEFKRTLVLVTDGAASDLSVADSVFAGAAEEHVRIFTVGVGAGAETDPPSPAALLIEELATRTGGIYAAADPPEEVEAILRTLAKSASPARLLLHLRLDPAPPAGTPISGTVTVMGPRGSATAGWSFLAP